MINTDRDHPKQQVKVNVQYKRSDFLKINFFMFFANFCGTILSKPASLNSTNSVVQKFPITVNADKSRTLLLRRFKPSR